jgi:1-acyl-sn-glycerol-3-phosphate acyltransferase
LAVVLGVATRRSYRGLAHVPRTGGVLVVCNHISLTDPPVLVNAWHRTGRLPRALAAAHLFPRLGWALRTMDHIPVLRGTDRAVDALAPAIAAQGRGELVMLYPEGGISDGDQRPRPAKTGAARLALIAGVPVPLAQWGVQRVLPPRTKHAWLRPFAALVSRPGSSCWSGTPLLLTGDRRTATTCVRRPR